MSTQPCVLVKTMRADHWEAVSKALCLAGEHLDSTIQELKSEDTKFSHGFMKNRILIEGLIRDREIIRDAHLAVLDHKTDYSHP